LANQPDLPIFASRQTSGVEVRAHLRRLMRHIRKNWPNDRNQDKHDNRRAREARIVKPTAARKGAA
jgi:hypothetical protein